MEFPDLGQHCSEATCHQLDFLPLRCDACEEIFCREHIAYKNHNCKSAYKKDFQVPVCPLCNSPIPMKKGERPDIVVGAHIDNDCQKAGNQKKIFNNKCSAKGCKVKEVVPVICNECQLNFCLKHRHPVDHQCEGAAGAARRRAMEAAVARQRKSNAGPSSRRASGIESSRQAPGNARVSRAEDIQGAMEEEDELQSFDAVFISQDDFIDVSDMNAIDPLIIKKENKTKKFVSLEKKKEVFPRQSSQAPEDHMKIGVKGQQYNTNVKRHNCEVCSKEFLYHSYLLSHMRVHTGERPYKCKVCSKTFTKYSSVKPHMRVHTGERPYKCQVCSKAFSQSSNLTYHMRVHTRETPFKCEVCSRTFTKYPSLTVHMRVHSR